MTYNGMELEVAYATAQAEYIKAMADKSVDMDTLEALYDRASDLYIALHGRD